MTLTITDLFAEGNFCEQLTDKELAANVAGRGVGAGSVSAGRYLEQGGYVAIEEAVTATVASSSRRPFSIDLGYTFEPRLSVRAGVFQL